MNPPDSLSTGCYVITGAKNTREPTFDYSTATAETHWSLSSSENTHNTRCWKTWRRWPSQHVRTLPPGIILKEIKINYLNINLVLNLTVQRPLSDIMRTTVGVNVLLLATHLQKSDKSGLSFFFSPKVHTVTKRCRGPGSHTVSCDLVSFKPLFESGP